MRLTPLMQLAAAIIFTALIPYHAASGEIILAAVGDIMLAGSASPVFKKRGLSHAFKGSKSVLKRGHIAIGNLEAPITDRGAEFTGKRFRFRSPPDSAVAIKEAGFSVLSLANNHIMDYGATGLSDSIKYLDSNSILHTGAGMNLDSARKPAILDAAGSKVAFLSYSLTYPAEYFAGHTRYGTAPGYAAFFRNDIKLARKHADHVVVSFHWGKELAEKPSPYQRRAARAAIDAGADVVLGHHPHVLQGIERYRNGLILYSLGNYAFGSRSRHADRSIIALISLNEGARNVEIIPLNVLNREVNFNPRPLQGSAGRQVVDRLARISEGMGTHFYLDSDRFMAR